MLGQTSSYAIGTLSYIAAGPTRSVLIKEVAQACGSPAPYLAKIINVLARRRLVVTQRGVGGGVALARPAADLSLYEVCQALDDEILAPRCLLGHVACTQDRSCPAHSYCQPSRERLLRFLQRTTIADIAQFEARRNRRREAAAPASLAPGL